MKLKFNYFASFVVALFVFTQILSQTAYANYSNDVSSSVKNTDSGISISEIVELFISLGIIAEDKIEQARSVVSEHAGDVDVKNTCPQRIFKYNLYLGKTDDLTDGEVTELQEWLADMPDIYPEGLVTGYFGPATERAVQRYQAKHGIVSSGDPDTTGYGVFGPMTRGKVNACSKVKSEKKKEYKKEEKKEEKKNNENQNTSDDVDSITLTADNSGKVTWDVDGYSSKGFKLVWSKNENPTYPTRSGDKYNYFSSPNTDEATITAFDGSGKYYVRVCEYLGGACGVYSNQVAVELE